MSTHDLDRKTLLLWCYPCKKTTTHTTLVKDKYTGSLRELVKSDLHSSFNGAPLKKIRKCLECGNIVKF